MLLDLRRGSTSPIATAIATAAADMVRELSDLTCFVILCFTNFTINLVVLPIFEL